MRPNISLDKVRMYVVSTADGGDVDSETLFEFAQEESMVSARYAGGKVRLGFLVGTIAGLTLKFRYVQIDIRERIDGGRSTCTLDRTENGRIRLVEHFQWESREGSGTNVLQEVSNS